MSLAAHMGHEISVDGDDNPKTENTVTCSCGWTTSVLPEFVVSAVQRHGYLFAGLKP